MEFSNQNMEGNEARPTVKVPAAVLASKVKSKKEIYNFIW